MQGRRVDRVRVWWLGWGRGSGLEVQACVVVGVPTSIVYSLLT